MKKSSRNMLLKATRKTAPMLTGGRTARASKEPAFPPLPGASYRSPPKIQLNLHHILHKKKIQLTFYLKVNTLKSQ